MSVHSSLSPEASLYLFSTKNYDFWPGPIFEHVHRICFVLSAYQLCHTWLWAWAKWQGVHESRTSGVGSSQRSQFLVLTKRSAAFRDEDDDCETSTLRVSFPLQECFGHKVYFDGSCKGFTHGEGYSSKFYTESPHSKVWPLTLLYNIVLHLYSITLNWKKVSLSCTVITSPYYAKLLKWKTLSFSCLVNYMIQP